MTAERVFVIGATGNVGTPAVKKLLAGNVAVTVFVRDVAKAKKLFGDNEHLTVVHGDLDNLAPLEQLLQGHTRVFLLTTANVVDVMSTVGKFAFAAGVKQIVNISGGTVGGPWRQSYFGHEHYKAEQALVEKLERPKDAYVVTLRPNRFMSNMLTFMRPVNDVFYDNVPADHPQQYISPRDIGELAAIILQDDPAKHGDSVYEMVGDVVTPAQRLAIFEKLLGRPFTYHQITSKQKFDTLNAHINFLPFQAILELATLIERDAYVSEHLSILLGREPETLEEYIAANRAAFQ